MSTAQMPELKHLLPAALIQKIKDTQEPLAKGQGQVKAHQEFLRLMKEANSRGLDHEDLIKNHSELLGLRSTLSLGCFQMKRAEGIKAYHGPHGNMFDDFKSRKKIDQQPYWMHQIAELATREIKNYCLTWLPDEIEHLVFLQKLILLKGCQIHYLPRSLKNIKLSVLALTLHNGIQMVANKPSQVKQLLEYMDKAGLLMTREEFLNRP